MNAEDCGSSAWPCRIARLRASTCFGGGRFNTYPRKPRRHNRSDVDRDHLALFRTSRLAHFIFKAIRDVSCGWDASFNYRCGCISAPVWSLEEAFGLIYRHNHTLSTYSELGYGFSQSSMNSKQLASIAACALSLVICVNAQSRPDEQSQPQDTQVRGYW